MSDVTAPSPPADASGVIPSHPWLVGGCSTASGGIVAEATPGIDPVTVFRHAAGLPHVVFLDTALADAAAPPSSEPSRIPRLGRYSFVAADPIHSLTLPPGADQAAVADAFTRLRAILADLACPTIPGLPPFQGGLAGLLSYDCGLASLGLVPPLALPP